MNYYELLGITQDADKATVKRAYFAKVKVYSPDREPEKFKEIRTSYEVLMDDKKRMEYDRYFCVEAGVQEDVLYVRKLMREKDFKKAGDYLTNRLVSNPGSSDLQRLLAEVYLETGKTGKAETVCKNLLADHMENADIWLLRGRIASARGHVNKAEEYYRTAVLINPMDAKVQMAFIDYIEHENPWHYFTAMNQAFDLSEDMFRDEYHRYLNHAGEYIDELGGKEAKRWLEVFSKYYLRDKNPGDSVCEQISCILFSLTDYESLIPVIRELAPALERIQSRNSFCGDCYEQLKAKLAYLQLSDDPGIEDVLSQLTAKLMGGHLESTIPAMEAHIVSDLPKHRKSLSVLLKSYPGFYKLHAAFYDKVMDPAKEHILFQAAYKNITGREPEIVHSGDEGDSPYVRKTAKVGRNAPCPCGSGKKNKHCCNV